MGTVNNQDLTVYPSIGQPFAAPANEIGDRQLLVERRDHDRQLGIRDIVGREQQSNLLVYVFVHNGRAHHRCLIHAHDQ